MQLVEKPQEWHALRATGIGGSDAPAIVGVSPFKTVYEVYLEKTGQLPPTNTTPAMMRGTVLEDIVAETYKQETGRKLRRVPEMLRHPEHAHMCANLDRQIMNDERGPGVLEIKCPGIRVFAKCKREGLPDYYQVQLQHYLAVTGRKWGAFAVFSAENWKLIHFDVEADPEIQSALVEMETEFWRKVQAGEPPEEPGGPEIKMPKTGGEVLTLDSPEWCEAVRELQEAKGILTEAKELEDAAKVQIQALMSEHNAGVVEGGGARVFWTEQAGRKSLDQAAMKADGIDLSKYQKTGKPSRPFRAFFLKENSNE